MRLPPLPQLLSRLALAACFLGFGVWELLAPSQWTTYLPAFLAGTAPIALVIAHGVALSAAALGVLSGYAPRFWWTLSTLLLLNITVEILLQEGFTDVFIRDAALSLFAAAHAAAAFLPSAAERRA